MRVVAPERALPELRIGGLEKLSLVDWPGELAAVVFCQGCAWNCRYCHNPHLIPFAHRTEISWSTVLEWLERQPWCTGACGMIGISWGGFNGLQVAARRPKQLKAIVTICSTDDRYADDIHTMGGCQLVDNVAWASTMFTLLSCPPDPALVGDRWREMWRERLEATTCWSDRWMRHQRRDAYWKRGSVCEDFSAIKIPVYAISGWDDTYFNAVPRLMQGLSGPRKGLIGPWTHAYPFLGDPGPAIHYLKEAIRWWRHWLEGVDTATLRRGMDKILSKHDIETIAPGYGCILRGKKTVEKHMQLVDDVLKSLDKSVATSRYVGRDEIR